MICIFIFFYQPVATGNYISYKKTKKQKKNSKNIKIVQIFHISLVSLAGHSLLCMLLGLLTALSYSDLVKSWRGECGGIGIRW